MELDIDTQLKIKKELRVFAASFYPAIKRKNVYKGR